jgi:hypothetical protein
VKQAGALGYLAMPNRMAEGFAGEVSYEKYYVIDKFTLCRSSQVQTQILEHE